MKKWLWYLAVLAFVTVLGRKPTSGNDIGKLQPVQVVCILRQENGVVVQTDTGDWGVGDTLWSATENMKETATKDVFLETADHLLLAPSCVELLPQIMEMLRPSCSLCLMEGEPDLEQVGQFLEFHRPELTLTQYQAGKRDLPTLKTENGRMTLVS